LDQGILASVIDPKRGIKTLGIRPEEREAYYYVLKKVREWDYGAQKAAARRFLAQRREQSKDPHVENDPNRPFPLFVDLFQNADRPEVYMGKPIRLSGYVRLLRQMPAGENRYGIRTLYEAWIYTDDSQHHPACVVCTALPDGMIQAFDDSEDFGSGLLNHVATTGYFFKMMGYRAQDAYRYAPLVLAQRLEWHDRNSRDAESDWAAPWKLVVVLLVVTGICWLGLAERSRRRRRQDRLKRSLPPSLPDGAEAARIDDGKSE